MAQIICVIGNKGGTGKTTLSHMLGHGLALLGKRVVVVLTDPTRQPLLKDGRRYSTADARNSVQLARVIDKLRGLKEWIGVIDGGANRVEMDQHLYALADLVLLPFRDSHEDIRTVLQDLERFPQALALPSQWPGNLLQHEVAQRTQDQLLGAYRSRLLDPVSAMSATKLFLQDQIPDRLPSALNHACRQLAIAALIRVGVTVQCDVGEPEKATPVAMAG